MEDAPCNPPERLSYSRGIGARAKQIRIARAGRGVLALASETERFATVLFPIVGGEMDFRRRGSCGCGLRPREWDWLADTGEICISVVVSG